MTDRALLLELRRLAAEVVELREAQDAALRAMLSRTDRRTGAALVPLLAEVFEDEPFTAADVAAETLNRRDAVGAALRELVADQITDTGGMRSFGRLLARLVAAEFDGHRLVVDGDRRDPPRYRVRQVSTR